MSNVIALHVPGLMCKDLLPNPTEFTWLQCSAWKSIWFPHKVEYDRNAVLTLHRNLSKNDSFQWKAQLLLLLLNALLRSLSKTTAALWRAPECNCMASHFHRHELHTANSSTNKLQCTEEVMCSHIRKTYVHLHKEHWKCFTAKRDNFEKVTTAILQTVVKWKRLHQAAVTQLLPHLSEDNCVNLWSTFTFCSARQWLKAPSGQT